MYDDFDYQAWRMAADYHEREYRKIWANSGEKSTYHIEKGKVYLAKMRKVMPMQGGYNLFEVTE